MINKSLRKEDVLELVRKLDISPTMFKSAKERYENLGAYFETKGIQCDIYPQGSFSLGTVVRPLNSDTDSFDLDFILQKQIGKAETSPKDVKQSIKDTLVEDAIYRDRLDPTEYDKCWTLVYADEFSMDIVPAVDESIDKKLVLETPHNQTKYSNNAIAITHKENDNYSWHTSNPKAYKEWFESINEPFKFYSWETNRSQIFKNNRQIFNSVEDIPEELNRTSLQRVIQIMKRHRDIYYDKKQKKEKKPASVILTTLTAQIAQNQSASLDPFELLSKVAESIDINIKKKNMTEDDFFNRYGHNYNQISFKNNAWLLENPVNPLDNLTDSWNNDLEIANLFFEWIKQLKKDFIASFDYEDDEFINTLENSFGRNFVATNITKNRYNLAEPKKIISTPKPWGA